MNSETFKGKWKEIKGKAKQEYGMAFNDDEEFTEGKFDEIVGQIQQKTGKAKEAIKEEISKW